MGLKRFGKSGGLKRVHQKPECGYSWRRRTSDWSCQIATSGGGPVKEINTKTKTKTNTETKKKIKTDKNKNPKIKTKSKANKK